MLLHPDAGFSRLLHLSAAVGLINYGVWCFTVPKFKIYYFTPPVKGNRWAVLSASIVITVCDVYICVFVCVSNSPSGVIFVLCFHGAVIVIWYGRGFIASSWPWLKKLSTLHCPLMDSKCNSSTNLKSPIPLLAPNGGDLAWALSDHTGLLQKEPNAHCVLNNQTQC